MVTCIAVSEAKHLGRRRRERSGSASPRSALAAGGVDQLARGLDCIAMSASMNWMPWKSAIALAELLALLDVADGDVERALGDAERLRADRRAGCGRACAARS